MPLSCLSRVPVLSAPAAAALLVLAGCGGDGHATPQAQVKAAVTRFGAASARKDYQLICDELIAPSLAAKVERLGLPCELAFKQGLDAVQGARLRVDGVRVKGDTAFAKVHTTAFLQPPSDDTLRLVRTGGAWRIVSLSAGRSPGRRPGTAPEPVPGAD